MAEADRLTFAIEACGAGNESANRTISCWCFDDICGSCCRHTGAKHVVQHCAG
jgi:hypothetical protein